MSKTLIVPGLDGSPAPHWQDWWARTDPNAMIVDLPDPRRPVREAWEAALAVMILRHPDSILVGHSLGSVLIAQMLAHWSGLKVRGAMLVAPADPHAGFDDCKRIRRFGPLPDRALDVPAVLVASRNDPWMAFNRSRDLADALGADLIDLGHAGHVNVASGFGPWPGGKVIRDRLLEQTERPSVLRRWFGQTAPIRPRLPGA
ncbi:alpha/beta hydrolase [Paracoccus sp. YIM 132242]|uniref:Alpha/beta hydrolase n=1 Tax=Paracoccus lichenicola TaxID=2665644 RepID=A0A6L6HM11_9RHOB|nr:alpha/beta hydrolase [Paracoccus lichenicola]MTE00217.1 alpha/beta hydrolase [Paracoccus lichenicola]